jgi:hypothetical protein
METKFIEGTNEQYSIREDGVVISHKRKKDKILAIGIKKKQEYKAQTVAIYYPNGKTTSERIETLLFKHFNINVCRECNCKFKNIKRKYFCTICIKKHWLINVKNWSSKNPDKVKEINKKSNAKRRKDLTTNYIRSVLNLKKSECSDELIELERTNIQIKRLLAKKLNVHVNTFQKTK